MISSSALNTYQIHLPQRAQESTDIEKGDAESRVESESIASTTAATQASQANDTASLPAEFFSQAYAESSAEDSSNIGCQICFGYVPVSETYELENCHHRFCKECLYNYVRFKVIDGNAYPKCCHDPNSVMNKPYQSNEKDQTKSNSSDDKNVPASTTAPIALEEVYAQIENDYGRENVESDSHEIQGNTTDNAHLTVAGNFVEPNYAQQQCQVSVPRSTTATTTASPPRRIVQQICDEFITHQDILRVLDDDVTTIEKYARFKYCAENKDARECPSCATFHIGNPSVTPKIHCSKCDLTFCYFHANAHDFNKFPTCAEYDASISADIKASETLINTLAKQCPSCRMMVIKSGMYRLI